MKDYAASAAKVKEMNARTVERESRKRSSAPTHNLILQLITAAALMGTIWLAATMRYTPGEIIAFAGCVVWDMLFTFANWRQRDE